MTPFKQLIDSKGIKQKWIADSLGVTETTVSRWVNGDSAPSRTMRKNLAALLEIPRQEVSDLFFEVVA